MKESTSRKELWDSAGKAGLVLGAVAIAGLLLQTALSEAAPKMGALLTFVANTALWVVKFVGCILLMRLFMDKYVSETADADHKDAQAFGTATAFLSAIIFAAFYLAYVKYLNPDFFQKTLDTALANYESMMDSNSLQALDSIYGKLPVIAFFGNLIYCFIYGSILSAILSRKYNRKNNPFEEN